MSTFSNINTIQKSVVNYPNTAAMISVTQQELQVEGNAYLVATGSDNALYIKGANKTSSLDDYTKISLSGLGQVVQWTNTGSYVASTRPDVINMVAYAGSLYMIKADLAYDGVTPHEDDPTVDTTHFAPLETSVVDIPTTSAVQTLSGDLGAGANLAFTNVDSTASASLTVFVNGIELQSSEFSVTAQEPDTVLIFTKPLLDGWHVKIKTDTYNAIDPVTEFDATV